MVTSLARRSNVYSQLPPSPDLAPLPTPVTLLPNNAAILVSDYATIVERSASRLRFSRPISDSFSYQHCSPGSRAAIRTDATALKFVVYYNALVAGSGPREGTASVLVDGVEVATIANPTGYMSAAFVTKEIDFDAAAMRTIELVWPYADGLDLVRIEANAGAAFLSAPPRPTGVLAACGDSITHGFSVPRTTLSWAFGLAAAKGRQLKNLANAGRTAIAADANALVGSAADRVTYLIGYNDFLFQNNVAAFQAAVEGWINNAEAALPTSKIYVISPIYSPNTNTIPLSSYRTAVEAAVAAAGGVNVTFVNGLALMANDNALLVDTIHPNAAGAAQIKTSLEGIVAG